MSSDALRLFLNDPHLRALLERLVAAYRRSGSLSSRVVVTESEANALMAIHASHGKRPGGHIQAKELDRWLRHSAVGLGFLDVVEKHTGQPVMTRRDIELQDRAEWTATLADLVDRCSEFGGADLARRWIEVDRRQVVHYTGMLEHDVIAVVISAAQAILAASAPITVAEIGAHYCGDAHAFDKDQAEGRLLLRVLMVADGLRPRALNTSERRTFLGSHGVRVDDSSSNVLVANLGIEGTPATEAPAGYQTLTLEQVEHLAPRIQPQPIMWVLENPVAWRALLEFDMEMQDSARPPIICSCGNPSLAAQVLISCCCGPETVLYYSGDSDQAGLKILSFIQRMVPAKVVPVAMAAPGLARCEEGTVQESVIPVIRSCFQDVQSVKAAPLNAPWREGLRGAIRRASSFFCG